MGVKRCSWAIGKLMEDYHDNEWGVPVHDDRLLFEFLILEGAQAGLSWSIILNRRENYREALDNFNANKIARYGDSKIRELLSNKGIVRNKLKILAAIKNAKAFLKVQNEFGSFDNYIWQFAARKQNGWKSLKHLPSKTQESNAMSKDLIRRGFSFVGPTICYAFMQAVGMAKDHTKGCFKSKK